MHKSIRVRFRNVEVGLFIFAFDMKPQFIAIVRSLVAIASIFCLSACIMRGPSDLKFVASEVVDSYDEPSPIPPSPSHPMPHQPMLKVHFSSKTNLLKFARKYGLTIGSDALFCHSSGSSTRRIGYFNVFWHGLDISLDTGPYYEFGELESQQNEIVYDVYFPLVQKVIGWRDVSSKTPVWPYDLQRDPEDVCFDLRGGNEAGIGFKTNLVTIPKKEIIIALRKAGLRP